MDSLEDGKISLSCRKASQTFSVLADESLVTIRRRWEDNIKMDLQEVGCGGMDWV